MCWNKGRLCWKTAKLFYFCHLKRLVRPETFGPYHVCQTTWRHITYKNLINDWSVIRSIAYSLYLFILSEMFHLLPAFLCWHEWLLDFYSWFITISTIYAKDHVPTCCEKTRLCAMQKIILIKKPTPFCISFQWVMCVECDTERQSVTGYRNRAKLTIILPINYFQNSVYFGSLNKKIAQHISL